MKRYSLHVVTLLLTLSWIGCGPSGADDLIGAIPGSTPDADGDGYTIEAGDCDDGNADVHPNAPDEVCNGVDNDCDGNADDGADADGDGYSGCFADCDDSNPAVNPGATEVGDGIDNDCNSLIDDDLNDVDDDGDGYSEVEGDCNDNEVLVSPDAVEVTVGESGGPEGVDNDCDGLIDEAFEPCDDSLSTSSAGDYAKAMDMCGWVESATFVSGSDADATNILGSFGSVYEPHTGSSMAVLSTGIADVGLSVSPNGGTEFSNSANHPDPQGSPGDGCGSADPSTVNDYVELTVDLTVPTNARSLSYDFNFMSGEFPEWVCTAYDDTFLAILESDSFTGNISFDAAGRPVTINIGFFDICKVGLGGDCIGDAELAGTGYGGNVGGGTGWLSTTAPVTPGETITLRFIIFDEGDRRYDSTVLLDNFRWEAEAVDAPITVERDPSSLIGDATSQGATGL